MIRKTLMDRLPRFVRSADGSVTVEAALMVPLLFTMLAVTFVFHDLFGFRNVRQKATFTVADVISRETQPLTATYLDNAKTLFDTMSDSEGENALRVSIVAYDAQSDTYSVDWSEVRGGEGLSPLTSGQVSSGHENLPTMSDEERLIVVDSFATYRPAFDVWIGEVPVVSRAFLRPRFAPQVLYQGS